MRRRFIAGNWKMNLTGKEATALAQGIVAGLPSDSVDVAICPPSIYLSAVGQQLTGSSIGLGGQNMSSEASGAYTGEISAEMLRDVGCKYVILGHSERRQLFGETSQQVRQKTIAAVDAGLVPIVCLGETLDQRESAQTERVLEQQLFDSLAGHTSEVISRVVIAYEPVWAIGTGKVATPAQAEEVHAHLRKQLETLYTASIADSVRIQYGGSVKPSNAEQLLSQPNIDGALVGGASLDAESFMAIIAAN